MMFPYRLSRMLPAMVVASMTLACEDSTAPPATTATAVRANTAVIAASPNKPKKNVPSISTLVLATTSVPLGNGNATTFTVTVVNPIGKTFLDVSLQGEIVQNGNRVGAGGFPLECTPGVFGVLPGGTCVDRLGNISTAAFGSEVLVAGPADFVLTLYQVVGAGSVTWSTVTQPIDLVPQ